MTTPPRLGLYVSSPFRQPGHVMKRVILLLSIEDESELFPNKVFWTRILEDGELRKFVFDIDRWKRVEL